MTKHAWWNDYQRIPYKLGGRDRDGLDCWGLVRLVYAEQFQRDLPSLNQNYDNLEDSAHLHELVATNKEGWQAVEIPQTGDVVLLTHMGNPHVGVCTEAGMFLHIRPGTLATNERLTSAHWRSRIKGYYRYSPVTLPVAISGIMHPLKTDRIDIAMHTGRTITQIIEESRRLKNIDPSISMDANVWVNGRLIEREMWDHLIPAAGSRVDIRTVARDGQTGKSIAMLAVMIIAAVLAPYLLTLTGPIFGAYTAGIYGAIIVSAGTMLVNAIFPVRMPEDPGTPKSQYLLTGSGNQQNQYGPIPVVLGRMRYAPVLGAKPYTEVLSASAYLRLALVWGYGPLQITDIRIGETPLEEYEDVEIETLEGTVDDNFTAEFRKIYGKDVEQLQPSIELLCPEFQISAANRVGTTVTVDTEGAHGYSTGAYAWINDVDATKGEITVVDSNTFTIEQPGERSGLNTTPVTFYDTDAEGGYIYNWDPGLAWIGTGGGTIVGSGTTANRNLTPSSGGATVAGLKYRVTMVIPTTGTGAGARAVVGGAVSAFVNSAGTHTFDLVAVDATGFYIEQSSGSTVSLSSARFRRRYTVGAADGAIAFENAGDDKVRASSWTSVVLNEEVEKITVNFHFPEGLRAVVNEGGNAGSDDFTPYRGRLQVRQLDSVTLLPITPWGDIDKKFRETVVHLPRAWYNIDNDDALEEVFQWHRFSVDEHGKVIMRSGAVTQNSTADPVGGLLTRLQNDNYGLNVTFTRLPVYGDDEEPLFDICVKGNSIFSTVDNRDADITGGALTTLGRRVTIASGTITRAQDETIRLGAEGERYDTFKDAFSYSVNFDVPKGHYEIQTRRENASNADFTYPSGNAATRFHRCFFQSVVGFSDRRPMVPPKPISASAIRIKATNQVNGNTEAFVGTATSIALDWDYLTSTWIERPTRNPASLMRLVLQHPGNARRVPDSKIMLDKLIEFHDYCRVNKFMYDGYHNTQRSLWDVLADICAAGRASPTRQDGRWSVIIDKPRTTVAQYFTPNNSWGFSGVKNLPKKPHAFRVEFINSERAYQPDERLVYNDGYSSANATLIEGLQLPGVTTALAIHKHARFHLAQLKLRSEFYTLNVDWEHLICTRGDLVRVAHYTPMWGLATGRISGFKPIPKLPENIAQDYTLWVAGTMPPAGFAMNGPAADNAMQNGDGPGGHTEPLWTCINSDTNAVGEEADGGFNSVPVATDCTKGHLFAVFMRTTTNNGTSYYGTTQSTDTLNLDGTTNTNPYFWNGDLPALNTWYLVVGYKHPIGYAGASAGIAGVYALDGTKVLNGTEFKFAAAATTTRHRSYHFYNAVITAPNPAQQMARPVIVPCTVAKASQTIARILAHGFGQISLDEPVPLIADVNHTIRIRLDNGTSVTRTVAPVNTDTRTRDITVTSAVTLNQVKLSNLFMLGNLNEESVELIVLSIEPSENECAQLNLVDYSPAIYDSDSEVVPPFDSQITEPPILQDARIRVKPIITGMRSDEMVMQRSSSGAFDYGIRISWRNPLKTPRRVNAVQLQIDKAGGKKIWFATETVNLEDRSYTFMGLRQGRSYEIRMRYVDIDGRTGPWVVSDIHQVVGKLTPPRDVTGLTVSVEGARLELDWRDNPEIDIKGYEVQLNDAGWGNETYQARTRASKLIVNPGAVGTTRTWYVKAYDYAGLYSTIAAFVSFTYDPVPEPAIPTSTVSASSQTTDLITFNWPNVTPQFGVDYYDCTLTLPNLSTRNSKRRVSDWTTPFNWVGDATLTIKTVDRRGNTSIDRTVTVNKLAPNNVGALTATADRRFVTIDWSAVAKTTLPVVGYEIRSTDSGFGTAGFLYRGPASIMRNYRRALGANNFYVRAYDTDGVYSAVSAFVSSNYTVPPNLTTVSAVRRRRNLNFTTTGPATPSDFSHYEFRIKLGGAGGDVWAAYDVAVKSQHPNYDGHTISDFGTYNISARMVDTEGNSSAASVNTSIVVSQLPAP